MIGGEPIGRIRQQEFDRREPLSPDRLLADLRAAVADVDRRLAKVSAETLLENRNSHDEEVTVLWCVFHIVEHFSMHTGQILSMAKAFVGELNPPAGR